MTLKSLVIDVSSGNLNVQDSNHISISIHNKLSMFRSQTFFTSACLIRNSKGMFLLCLDTHYKRLKHCYETMFERTDFPVSFQQLKNYMNCVVEENNAYEHNYLHCIILCVAGNSRNTSCSMGAYNNGFEGDLAEIIILVEPFEAKPDWCFNDGLNVMTYKYQRPIAQAKPTFYMGGICAQHEIDAINAYACVLEHTQKMILSSALCAAINCYQALSVVEKKAFRFAFRTTFFQGKSAHNNKPLQYFMKSLPEHIQIELSNTNLTVVQKQLSEQYNVLLHEAIFISPNEDPEFVLEGTTFSLLAINNKNQLVFTPCSGNTNLPTDLNSGHILQSTFMEMLYAIAKKHHLPHVVKSIAVSELSTLNALYCVSTRRCTTQQLSYQFQLCKTVNGNNMNYQHTNIYEQLLNHIQTFIQDYDYDCIIVPEIEGYHVTV